LENQIPIQICFGKYEMEYGQIFKKCNSHCTYKLHSPFIMPFGDIKHKETGED
jgi:hypothetical protein